MSLWNCKFMDWVEGKLLTITNKLWQKRHPVKPAAAKPIHAATSAPSSEQSRKPRSRNRRRSKTNNTEQKQ